MAVGEGLNGLDVSGRNSYMKQHITKQENTLQKKYMPICEVYLHKAGLRGRKGMLFYGLVILLFIIALINLTVIIVLLCVLRIGYGMESMEFVHSGMLLRFLNHADMGTVIPDSGVIGGFSENDLSIIGNSQPVIFKTASEPHTDERQSGASIEINHDWTLISGVDDFVLRSPTTGQKIFSTEYENFKLPTGVSQLSIKEAHVSRIVSKKSESLEISSPYQILLKGNEGLMMEGHEVTWTTGLDLHLKSVNQSIILDGNDGVMISADKLPVANNANENTPRRFKVCVCMPSGRVFRIRVSGHGYGCQDVRFPESINPCS